MERRLASVAKGNQSSYDDSGLEGIAERIVSDCWDRGRPVRIEREA